MDLARVLDCNDVMIYTVAAAVLLTVIIAVMLIRADVVVHVDPRRTSYAIAAVLIVVLFIATPFVVAALQDRQEDYYALGIGLVSMGMIFLYTVLGVTAGVVVSWKKGRREGSIIMIATAIGLLLGVFSCFAAVDI